MQGIKFSRFDQVQLKTTRNVTYLSAPPQTNVSPKGIWQVAGVVSDDLLLVKNNAIIRIPATDVLKVIDYNINTIVEKFGRLREYGQESRQSGKKENTE